jgi:NADH:ubiquinone oxidoreductase subunit 4 (subunit M)
VAGGTTMSVIVEPFRHRETGQIKYKLGIDGVSRQLILNTQELKHLNSLIQRVLEDSHATTPAT